MEDKIIIPMIAKEDIEESIPAMGIGCKKGEVFMYDPENQIHVNLKDNGVLADMPNNKCDFICNFFPRLELGNHEYEFGEVVNQKNIDKTVLFNLTFIGYLKKVVKTEEPKQKAEKKEKSQSKTKTNKNNITYTKLAKEYKLSAKDFKEKIAEKLGYNISDMRKNVPSVKLRAIKKILEKK